MVAFHDPVPGDDRTESFLARLTEAAYGVMLRHGIRGSFAELELDLWRELRTVVDPAPTCIARAEHGVG